MNARPRASLQVPPLKRCMLGIDSGGTKCEALVATGDAVALGWGRCDVRHPRSGRGWGGSGRSRASIRSAVRDALKGVRCEELLVASIGLPRTDAPLVVPRMRTAEHLAVFEYDAALALAGETCGIVALAGTGAFVFVRTRDGRERFLDGVGPLLGDYGSGYAIGSLALRAAARAAWHPRHRTALVESIAQAIGGHSVFDPRGRGDLIRYAHGNRDRGEISELARLVLQAADAGDAVAVGILHQAADALAATLRDAVDELGIAADDYPLIGNGGIIAHSRLYWDRFCAAAMRVAPRLRPLRLKDPPVLGAVLCALRAQPGPDAAVLRANLAASAAALLATCRT